MTTLFDKDTIIKKSLKKSSIKYDKNILNKNDNENSILNRTFETPMMIQYQKLKVEHNDCLLFFRLGDFYEMFLNDAVIASKVLDINLTKRERGKDGYIPMAGIPFHAVDSYLSKLVKNGYKVAIAEQVGDINGKELVTREVVRIVTPGTILSDSLLDKKENNYIFSMVLDKKYFGLAISDLSTGNFYTEEYSISEIKNIIHNELVKYNITECILPKNLYDDPTFLKLFDVHKDLNIYPFYDFNSYTNNSSEYLKNHFNIKSLKSFNIDKKHTAIKASSALLGYLKHTQKSNISHIKNILSLQNKGHMQLNRATITNLELFSTLKEHSKKGTLLYYLDNTITAMGGRLLKNWLIRPLTDKNKLVNRFEAVDYYIKNENVKNTCINLMQSISDIERILSKISLNAANPRDVITLAESLKNALELIKINKQIKYLKINNDYKEIFNLVNHINNTIIQDPALDAKNGGYIKKGISKKLDDLNDTIFGSKKYITNLQEIERENTKISSLKIKFNQVFGYYIEITKSNLSQVPSHYIRKQTMVNSERYITDDLKKHEEIILSNQSIARQIEYELFVDLCNFINNLSIDIQDLSNDIAKIDCLICFSNLAIYNKLVKPILKDNGVINIKKNRHPVVESILDHKEFVSNDVCLDNNKNQLLVITGPNMAGKSVYLRQVAITMIMAQIGCFIPAEKAEISLVDNIFVRSGASDIITAGLSTFMVEMVETSHILLNATNNSLVIMDEIGRGTSTYDGISIAWAIAEFLVNYGDHRPKTLFATHYHELTNLSDFYVDNIKNYHFPASEYNGEPVFLHTLKVGGASSSFGIQVAKIAGLPKQVYENAQNILDELTYKSSNDNHNKNILHELTNKSSNTHNDKTTLSQVTSKNSNAKYNKKGLTENSLLTKNISKKDAKNDETNKLSNNAKNNVYSKLQNIDINKITPIDALIKLQELKDLL